MKSTKQLTIEGFTPEQILALSDEELNKLVFIDEPIVFKAGSAEIIGKFYLKPDTLVLELAQIEGGRSVLQLFKRSFFGAAFGATPIIGQIFKGRARKNMALVVAHFGIVDVFDTGAFIT
jgi:hypothetical protein